MTISFVALKAYKPLGASKGDLLVQSEDSADELKMSELVGLGYFKEVSEVESLEIYKQQSRKEL